MEEIKYGIIAIDEYDYSFNYDADFEGVDIAKVRYRLSHHIKAQREENRIEVRMKVSVFSPDSEIRYAEDAVRLVFSVEPFDSFVTDVDENGFNVSQPNLMDTFLAIAIGALRGILAKNLKGTPLNGCILPLITMKDISRNARRK